MPVNITGTNRVGELPPTPILGSDNFPHETGDVLGKATIDELVAFIKSGLSASKYEIKYIRAPNNAYITDNFDMTIGENQGLGKAGGLWEGWAICNGNNGTDNLNGRTLIGYGASYNTIGQMGGSPNAQVIEHFHGITLAQRNGENPDSTTTAFFCNSGSGSESQAVFAQTSTSGYNGTGLNMQPFMVTLIIQKL